MQFLTRIAIIAIVIQSQSIMAMNALGNKQSDVALLNEEIERQKRNKQELEKEREKKLAAVTKRYTDLNKNLRTGKQTINPIEQVNTLTSEAQALLSESPETFRAKNIDPLIILIQDLKLSILLKDRLSLETSLAKGNMQPEEAIQRIDALTSQVQEVLDALNAIKEKSQHLTDYTKPEAYLQLLGIQELKLSALDKKRTSLGTSLSTNTIEPAKAILALINLAEQVKAVLDVLNALQEADPSLKKLINAVKPRASSILSKTIELMRSLKEPK